MYNILIFGDSIAAGRRVEKVKSWPCLLAQFIDIKDKDLTFVHNLSIPGESTDGVIKRFSVEAGSRCKRVYPNDHASIVFAIGINDTKCVNSRNNPVRRLEDFKKNIISLIESASKYTDHVIFVGLTLVDERKTAPIDNVYFLNENIKKYNKTIKEVCKKRDILFLDISEEWSSFNYLNLLSDDGIHPNEKGHQKIFEKIKSLFR